jgi:membrane protein YdbS with pleckstrin-like domain
MSYADSLLVSGERIILRQRQHPFVLLWSLRLAIIGLILALVLLILRAFMSSDLANGIVGQAAGILTLLLVIGGLISLVWTAVRYRSQEYVITSRRIIHTEGVFNKKSTDSSLEKINDAVLTQSFFGRIFKFGDLEVLTASEEGIERLRMLVDAIGFKKAMLEAKHELEMELTRPVMPPLRSTTSTTTSSADAPTGPVTTAPREPAPAAMTADDVTKALAGLADLRDRGAVTPEEYEAKKAELLARL